MPLCSKTSDGHLDLGSLSLLRGGKNTAFPTDKSFQEGYLRSDVSKKWFQRHFNMMFYGFLAPADGQVLDVSHTPAAFSIAVPRKGKGRPESFVPETKR